MNVAGVGIRGGWRNIASAVIRAPGCTTSKALMQSLDTSLSMTLRVAVAHAHLLRHTFAAVTLEQLQRGHISKLAELNPSSAATTRGSRLMRQNGTRSRRAGVPPGRATQRTPFSSRGHARRPLLPCSGPSRH
jgi:hypothetical protein